MPSPHRGLTASRAAEVIADCFSPAPSPAPTTRVGIEIEWLTYLARDCGDRPDLAVLEAATTGADGDVDGAVTFEPGGQIEVSTRPAPRVDAACAAAASAAAHLEDRLRRAGVELAALGLDPIRPPRRVTTAPRYVAMEAYFDRLGPAGRQMMCGTAAVQVNLDLGSDGRDRWRVAHAVGPVLTAAFANSPFAHGRPTGHRSTRMAVWAALDPWRCAPVDGRSSHHDPVAAWERYALDAPVMLVREGDERYRPLLQPVPFGVWLDGAGAAAGAEGFPDEDDLAYHLTTLFPPVRPRGWLELRMIDALPDPWWQVAVAVATALVTDARAAGTALDACAGSHGWWAAAARDGLAHPGLAAAARRCFAAALEALPDVGAGAGVEAACAAYADRYVERGRCPADELLARWAHSGELPVPARVRHDSEEVPSWT